MVEHMLVSPEYCLVGWSSEIQHSVVKPGVLVDSCKVSLLFISDPSASILQYDWSKSQNTVI